MMKRSRQRNFGGLPEWLKGADCKSVGYAYTGSNPVAPTSDKTHELPTTVSAKFEH